MNNNVLVSTAFLCSIWDNHNKDTLDLLLPFLKYAIGKQTQVGKIVDIETVTGLFKIEFGYDTIPHNVIISMLNRLSPAILSKKNGTYTLVSSLDEDIEDFEKRRTVYKERRNKVGNALAAYLNAHILKLDSNYDCDSALLVLIAFFVNNGLVLAQTPEQLSLMRKKANEKSEYCVAQFIVEEQKKESELFDYIVDMVKGFFVSTAISFEPENLSLPHSKFKNVCCYLDTRILIDALGLRLKSGQIAALELLEMLKSEQATLCCFSHTIEELKDIIKAYRKSLETPGKRVVFNTLESWDEQNYTVVQVNRYLSLLSSKIAALGITVVPSPAQIKTKVNGLKVGRFLATLKQKVVYHSDSAYHNDVLSVMGVMKLRKGKIESELEKCGHIFITTNTPLIGVANSCLKDPGDGVPPVISDTTLSSVIWFKCYSSHKDYPKYKLLDNALLALEPSNSLMNEFYNVINRMVADGGLSEDEAAIISTDIMFKRELADTVQGDSSLVNQDMIVKMKNRLKERYVGENKAESDENYSRFIQQKNANNQALTQIIHSIDECGERVRSCVSKFLHFVTRIIATCLLLCFAGYAIAGFVLDKKYWIGAVILLLANIASFFDLCIGKRKLVHGFNTRIACYFADVAMEHKRREYQAVIEKLTNASTE